MIKFLFVLFLIGCLQQILPVEGTCKFEIDRALEEEYLPSAAPSYSPSDVPSSSPSHSPSNAPSPGPSITASDVPSGTPSNSPSGSPSVTASDVPSGSPSNAPSVTASDVPSGSPSVTASDVPSGSPSNPPSVTASDVPSGSPSNTPSRSPSVTASDVPSLSPSNSPSNAPSGQPSQAPFPAPSDPSSGGLARRLSDGVDKHKKCSPRDLERVEQVFKGALKTLEPELPASEVDSWAAPRIAEIEKLNDEVCHHGKALKMTLRWLRGVDWTALFNSIDWNNIDWDEFDWGQDDLPNGASTRIMKCVHDEAEHTKRERELEVSTPVEDKQDERHLQYCPGFCYSVGNPATYWECWGCFRRRRELSEGQQQLHLAQVQGAVDVMYNECLAMNIGCMDCSSVRVCTDEAVDPHGDPICVGATCKKEGNCESSLVFQ